MLDDPLRSLWICCSALEKILSNGLLEFCAYAPDTDPDGGAGGAPEPPLCDGNRSLKLPLCEAVAKFEAIWFKKLACCALLELLAADFSSCEMLAVTVLKSAGFDLLSCSSSENSWPGPETLVESLADPVEVVCVEEEEEVELACELRVVCKSCARSVAADALV